jgi:hypothetical protein
MDPTQIKIIVGAVVGTLVFIAIIVAIVLVTRRVPTPLPTVTPTDSHHFPINISPIDVANLYEVNVLLGGVSAISSVLYLQSDFAGVIFSANHVKDDFATVNINSSAQNHSNDLPISKGYSSYSLFSGATFATDSQFITLFELNLPSTTINNQTILNNVPTTDPTQFNSDLYIVSDQNSSVIVSSLVLTTSLQSYALLAFQQNGTSIPNLKLTNPIPVASNYILLLASSGQDFFALFIFDQTQSLIYDLFYSNSTTDIQTFTVSGTLVSGAITQSTNVLIILTTRTLYLYTRVIESGARPTYQLTDFISFTFDLKSCSLDTSGQFFSISTSQKTIIIGQIIDNLFSNLRLLDVSKQPTALSNTNGPNGIQVNDTNIYVLQTDTTQNGCLFQMLLSNL